MSSSSFLPPFPPQQAKVRNKTAHLQNSRRHVWKKLTRQPAVQESLAAGACLGVSTERGTVGRKRSTGPLWGAWASPLANTVGMPLGPLHEQAKSRDHEIVRAHLKKVSVQRPSQHTHKIMYYSVTDPQEYHKVIRDQALNPNAISTDFYSCGSSLWIGEIFRRNQLRS